MGCLHPLLRHYDSKADERNKHSNGENMQQVRSEVHSLKAWQEMGYAVTLDTARTNPDWSLIPCNRCFGCMAAKKRDWTTRQALEASCYPSGTVWFLTLTYDDAHVPAMIRATGELTQGLGIQWRPGTECPDVVQVLNPDDQRVFAESLKQYVERHPEWGVLGHQLKFYWAGEYGEQTCRPHYHATVFGLVPQDLQALRRTGGEHYTSPYIAGLWGKGQIMLMPALPESMAYVAGYVVKKQGDQAKQYRALGLVPPYQARTAGLSRDEYERQKDKFYPEGDKLPQTGVILPGGIKASVPKYWDRLMLAENPQRLWAQQLKRKQQAIWAEEGRRRATDVDLETYLENREKAMKQRFRLSQQMSKICGGRRNKL